MLLKMDDDKLIAQVRKRAQSTVNTYPPDSRKTMVDPRWLLRLCQLAELGRDGNNWRRFIAGRVPRTDEQLGLEFNQDG